LVEFWVEGPSEYPKAFGTIRAAGTDALVIIPTPEVYRDIDVLAGLSVDA